MPAKGQPRQNRDWELLKREFLATTDTANQFMQKKGISNSNIFYKHVRDDNWMEERGNIQQKITQDVTKRLIKAGVDEWQRQLALMSSIENQVAFMLKKHVGPDGHIISQIDPRLLRSLAATVESSVRMRKTIKGEPVIPEGGGNVTINFQQNLIKIINEVENDGSGPTPLSPPEFNSQP